MNNLTSIRNWVNGFTETRRTLLSNAIVGAATFGVASVVHKATNLVAGPVGRVVGSASGALALLKQGATLLAGATALARVVTRGAALLNQAPAAIDQLEAVVGALPIDGPREKLENLSQLTSLAAPIAAQLEKASDQFNQTFGKTVRSINPRTLTIATIASAVFSVGPLRWLASLAGAHYAGDQFAKEFSARTGLEHNLGSIEMGLIGGGATYLLTGSRSKALTVAGTVAGLSSVLAPNFFRDATDTMNRWTAEAKGR